MNKASEIVLIYSMVKNACYIQESGQPLRELTIKGACEYQGEVNSIFLMRMYALHSTYQASIIIIDLD